MLRVRATLPWIHSHSVFASGAGRITASVTRIRVFFFCFSFTSFSITGFSAVIPGFPRYSVLGDRQQGVYNLKVSNASLEDDAEFQCQVGPAKFNSAIRANAKLTVICKYINFASKLIESFIWNDPAKLPLVGDEILESSVRRVGNKKFNSKLDQLRAFFFFSSFSCAFDLDFLCFFGLLVLDQTAKRKKKWNVKVNFLDQTWTPNKWQELLCNAGEKCA